MLFELSTDTICRLPECFADYLLVCVRIVVPRAVKVVVKPLLDLLIEYTVRVGSYLIVGIERIPLTIIQFQAENHKNMVLIREQGLIQLVRIDISDIICRQIHKWSIACFLREIL